MCVGSLVHGAKSGETNHGNLHHSNDHFIAAYVQLLYKRLGREASRAVGLHHSNDHFIAAYMHLSTRLCSRPPPNNFTVTLAHSSLLT
jgi:hypothetical protein